MGRSPVEAGCDAERSLESIQEVELEWGKPARSDTPLKASTVSTCQSVCFEGEQKCFRIWH